MNDILQTSRILFGIIKDYWAKGLATEAALACINYSFKNNHLKIIYGAANPKNNGSIIILEKIGMKRTNKVDFYGNGIDYFLIENLEEKL